MKEIIERTVISLICIAALMFVPYYSGVFVGYCFDKPYDPSAMYWVVGVWTDLFLLVAIVLIAALISWIITGDVF